MEFEIYKLAYRHAFAVHELFDKPGREPGSSTKNKTGKHKTRNT